MAEQPTELEGPDLINDGVPAAELTEEGMVLGHADGQAVVLARIGGEVLSIGGRCTHYGGPLGKGVFDGERVRCPWHHARFDVRTGMAEGAPALNPVPAYGVEERDGLIYVTGKVEAERIPRPIEAPPDSVVILGAGAAGGAAAEMLRHEGYEGPITMIGADESVPYDRPNLSKDYLAGTAPEEWIPLRSLDFYAELGIDLFLGSRVTDIDTEQHVVTLDDGSTLPYGALLLATGAEPVRLAIPGADLPHVYYLRTLNDSRAIIAAIDKSQKAVVIGASFIGMEVAASLRTRGLEVHVVAPDSQPMERALGTEVGAFVRTVHEERGVHFHLGLTARSISEEAVGLSDGSELDADLVVIGVGVRPEVDLAERTGLKVDNGVVVDEYLRTSDDHIWAAGDVARWPDHRTGQSIRVEHWVVAQRQGQAAARNILGHNRAFTDTPFFWSQHYDVPINYVGHAADWDGVEVTGSIEDKDAIVSYRKDGKTLAVATIYRDVDSLRAEVAMDRDDDAGVEEVTGG